MALLAAKWPGLSTSEFVSEYVSLAGLPEKMQSKLAHILFVPLGAMLVVLVRLSLGLRVLGPFRSILLAVAFQTTGAVLGLLFLTVTIVIVVAIRNPVGGLKMPYFGRITVMLSTVAVLMTFSVMVGDWLHVNILQTIAYLPIVVLCLVADAFGRTVKSEGIRSALWRALMTAMVAVALSLLAKSREVRELVLRYPELLVAQIGAIIFISLNMDWRLLERLNPKVGEDEEDDHEKEWLKS